jgi:inner membrane transporter RhtA
MSAHRSPSWLPLLAILGSITFLCLGTSWAKNTLFPTIGAQGTTGLRIGFAAVLMLLFWRPWQLPLARKDRLPIALYGCALGLMCLAFYMSLLTLPFGISVAVQFAGPLTVAVCSSRRALDFVWIAVAIVGLGLLLPLGQDVNVGALDPVGLMWSALGGISWACYILFGKRLAHLPIRQSAPWGTVVAALVVLPVGIAHAGAALLSPGILITAIGVALVSCAIPFTLELFALKHLPKNVYGTMTSMEPVVAALLALMFLGEVLTLHQTVAIGLIMLASMGCAFTAKPQAQLQGQH